MASSVAVLQACSAQTISICSGSLSDTKASDALRFKNLIPLMFMCGFLSLFLDGMASGTELD